MLQRKRDCPTAPSTCRPSTTDQPPRTKTGGAVVTETPAPNGGEGSSRQHVRGSRPRSPLVEAERRGRLVCLELLAALPQRCVLRVCVPLGVVVSLSMCIQSPDCLSSPSHIRTLFLTPQ